MDLVKYSAKGQRELSSFYLKELLYEHAIGALDPVRDQVVQEALKTDPEMQKELVQMKKGLAFLEQMQSLEVTTEAIQSVREAPNWASRVHDRMQIDRWPSGLRLGLETTAVVGLTFCLALLIPWNSIFDFIQNENGELTLAEVRRESQPKLNDDTSNLAVAANEGDTNKFVDEGLPKAVVAETTKSIATTVTPTLATTSVVSPLPARSIAADENKAVAAPAAPVAAAVPAAPVAKATPMPEPAAALPKTAKTRGSLYRGRLRTTNVEAANPKLVDYVTQLGGRKAGQVPIGWKKGQGSYFHFTIPEAKYEELTKFFREYGDFTIDKESHEKVMPEGIIRVIIDVEEQSPST